MKIVLFCHLSYCFSILKPIEDEANKRGYSVLWYLDTKVSSSFPYANSSETTLSIQTLVEYQPDAIFVPGNDVPHYLTGVKIQVFHGFAGEKRTHFKIRDYFDLYFTQGPYFTERFMAFERQHRNFKVVETGWSGVDRLFIENQQSQQSLRDKYGLRGTTILYAPTASPKLTSVEKSLGYWSQLVESLNCDLLIKFHPLINTSIQQQYRQIFENNERIKICDEADICRLICVADLLVSDTSSVVYECLLLEKPVVTIGSVSTNIVWQDIDDCEGLVEACRQAAGNKHFPNQIFERYNPYKDGASSCRMMDALEQYIETHGVPKYRKVNFFRRRKMNRRYGKY